MAGLGAEESFSEIELVPGAIPREKGAAGKRTDPGTEAGTIAVYSDGCLGCLFPRFGRAETVIFSPSSRAPPPRPLRFFPRTGGTEFLPGERRRGSLILCGLATKRAAEARIA